MTHWEEVLRCKAEFPSKPVLPSAQTGQSRMQITEAAVEPLYTQPHGLNNVPRAILEAQVRRCSGNKIPLGLPSGAECGRVPLAP